LGSAGSIIPCRTGKFREQIRVGAALFAKNNVISDAYNAKLTPLGRSGRGSLTIFGWVELAYPIIAFMMRFDLDAKMANRIGRFHAECAAVRHLIDRGDELGGLDRVALLHQGQK